MSEYYIATSIPAGRHHSNHNQRRYCSYKRARSIQFLHMEYSVCLLCLDRRVLHLLIQQLRQSAGRQNDVTDSRDAVGDDGICDCTVRLDGTIPDHVRRAGRSYTAGIGGILREVLVIGPHRTPYTRIEAFTRHLMSN